MGFFFEGYNVITVLTFAIVIAVIMAGNEVTRRSKKLSIVAYMIVPAVIFILCVPLHLIGTPSGQTWFGWVKCISSLIGVIGFMAMRYTKFGNMKYAYYFPVAILVINILEAMYKDVEVFLNYQVPVIDSAGIYQQGGVWNLMNALAGLFLVLSLTGWMGIQISKNKSQDMIWPDQLWFWIIAYDFWNVAYCYNAISTRSMYAGLAIIIACTLSEIIFQRGAWLQHRAQTLALFAMFSLIVDYQQYDAFAITSSYNPNALFALSFMALVVNAAVFIYEIHTIKKYKRNPLKEDVYTHLEGYKKNLEANNL
ncbi:MAG: DUF5692 family protein [Eubacteriales bacterium]